ncbi:MAG TPA: hypothetical protein VGM90_27535 [Kofleriaceae bacterium]|jgi:ABC-type phosphate/phosphonate transport system substrate-binding protein
MKTLASRAIIVAVVFATACGGAQSKPNDPAASNRSAAPEPAGGGPTCDDVVAHVKDLSIVASGATSDEQKEQAVRDVEPALADLSDECERGWSPTFRTCVVAAKSREDVAICDKANAKP